ncbi:MAG: GspE/PulE family protein, partial [bacterium]|nr:GspE/PulE family protein [bacterium]
MMQVPVDTLKQSLMKDGLLAKEEFETMAAEAQRSSKDVAEVLIGRGIITSDYYSDILGRYYGVPLIKLTQVNINPDILHLLSEEYASQHQVVPFSQRPDGSIDLGMVDPSDLAAIQFLENKLQAKVNPHLISRENFISTLSLYGKKHVENFRSIIERNIKASLKLKDKGDEEAATELPIIEITDNLISYAVSLGASDVHIEALEEEILVRYRVDGILHEIIRMQKEIHAAIVARFKILASVKLDEHTKPQDGRFHHKIGSETIDIRLSILPTLYGEKVELRLLGASDHILSFEELGMRKETIDILNRNVNKSFGMVLITGPTGSGKSTTLYSILNTLNKPEVNIVTVEDPIEYNMKYVNQTQINPAAGVTFASALRAILRQDPNIIMVGEIRDSETAEISVHSALTGHLLLSSLHTNDSATAIPRLNDLKVPRFLISAVLNAIAAQRLVRRICMDCMYSYEPAQEILESLQSQIQELQIATDMALPKLLFKGKGCKLCGESGYRGRLGIYE